MSYCPLQVSETPDKPVEDCAPSSDEMALMKATLGASPSDLSIVGRRAERERIRTATGHPHGGLSIADINRANQKLYGAQLDVLSIPFSKFISEHMDQDDGAVLLGSANQLTKHFNRWDPAFGQSPNSGHAVYIQGTNPAGKRYPGHCWWMNPLAPWGYPGEWIANPIVRAYAWGIGQSGLIREGAWLFTGGGVDPVSLVWNPTNPAIGTITLKGPGHSLISPGDWPDITNRPDGQVLPCFGTNRLDKPYNPGAGDRQDVYETSSGGLAYFVLFADATFKPNPTPPAADCSAAVQMRDQQWLAHLTPPK